MKLPLRRTLVLKRHWAAVSNPCCKAIFDKQTKSMEILNVSDRIDDAYRLLKQLRNDLSFSDFKQIYDQANQNDSYTFFGVENEQHELIGLIGFRILYDFLHLKHLYIDDLIITPNARFKGVGKMLLDFAEHMQATMDAALFVFPQVMIILQVVPFTKNLDGRLKL